jgi:transposase-like protein
MKVVCPFCKSAARIGSRHDLNDNGTISDLYCQCLDSKNCGATFKYKLSYDAMLNPPLRMYKQTALDLVSRMTMEEKKELQRDMFASM